MPTYDYKCKDCGHHFEAFHSMSADPLTDCPECEGQVERQIGMGAGVLFKGSGFYETDYRSSGYKKDKASDKPAKSAPKKDEKSASKKDAKKAQ
ncbi:zinc ribbon domain-containing protein [Pontiellaceae bacterium B12227]|nr:zinc ribbon domain-containing protein [Pontiellaceae bacterium B12227]